MGTVPNNDSPGLYNIRIIRTYIEYLNKNYPDVNINEVLEYAGITHFELDDLGFWYTQETADRFHEIINKKTGNPHIAREAGRYVVSSKAYSLVRQILFGSINTQTAYSLLPTFHAKLSKGAKISVNTSGPNKLKVISTPLPGIKEKSYQCENRIGQFEALAAVFTGHHAEMDHPVCFHRGDKQCEYLISWVEPTFLKVRRWRNYIIFAGLILCGALAPFIPHHYNMILLTTLLVSVIGITTVSWYLEKISFKKQVEDQAHTAELLILESNIRSNEANLIQEIGQAISRILDVDDLLDTVMNTLKNRLDFDRGIVFLANNVNTRLIYKAGYGFSEEQEDFLKSNELHLDNPDSKGPFVVSFRDRRPFFVDDVKSINYDLSPRSQELLMLTESTSFICVPILFGDMPLGILSVDRLKSTIPLKQSDLNLIMGIAPQIAISIHNARTFEKMQASEEKYRVLVESANSIILRINPQGQITFVNRFAQEFYGYSEQEMLGKEIIGLIMPGSDSKGRDLSLVVHDLLNNPEAYVTSESECVRRSGERVWVSWSNKAIRDKDGKNIEVLCVGSDITSRKKAEEEKRLLEDQLVRAQKMEAIGALAGGVAHDLNNILSGITSYPELLLMEIPEGSPMRKAVQTIKKSGDKAAAIVQDLLTLARRGVSVSNVVDLNTIARDYFESPEFSKLQEYHAHVNFEIRLDDELKYILGSEIHLGKTLMNLVSNAAEAMMSNGGTVTVSTGNKYLERPLKGYDTVSQGEYVVLTVADTGIGISEGDLKRIFEPFFSKKTMGRSGTGLGMTVVWSTIKDHNGYIDVESEEGRGTRFNLYFPVTRHILKEKIAKGSIQDYSGTEHILVVDDDEQQRDITKNVLKKLGYKVDVARSGEDAVEFIKLYPVDLVILDMIMDPGIDGLETYKRMLAIRGLQKVIVVSGFSETDRVREALKLGVGAYIRKPYALSDLARAVRSELDKTKDTLPHPPVSIP
jgi:PAS domain S-box-containing protein